MKDEIIMWGKGADKVGEKERERRLWFKLLFSAELLCKTSVCVSGRYSTQEKKQHSCSRIFTQCQANIWVSATYMKQRKSQHCCSRCFTRSKHVSRKLSFTINAPSCNISIKDPFLSLTFSNDMICQSDLRIVDIFPEKKSPLPCKVLHMWCSSKLFPCFHYPGYLGSGYFSIKYFHSNLVTPWPPCESKGTCLRSFLKLTHWGFDDGYPEMWFWRYADTNVKKIHLMCGTIRWKLSAPT